MKKIAIVCMLVAVFILAVSFASAVVVQTKNIEKKSSPIYNFRAVKAINAKEKILDVIRSRFITSRILFNFPMSDQRNSLRSILQEKSLTRIDQATCEPTGALCTCNLDICLDSRTDSNIRNNFAEKCSCRSVGCTFYGTCNPFTVCYCKVEAPSCNTGC